MLSYELLFLCLASFAAGLVDSIVGGGGLIQLPCLILTFPNVALVNLLGTNKIVSLTGTAISAYRYSRQMTFLRSIIFPTMLTAFLFSGLGAFVVSIVSNEILKPVFMIMLFLIFILTIRNKHFGMQDRDPLIIIPLWKPVCMGAIIGFYDGFFGPGTGSLLIIGFIGLMGMTFVQGSAHAKIINLSTNAAAVLYFVYHGSIIYEIVLPMMLFNMAGAVVGVRLALLKGNTFVRGLLRLVIFATISKLAFDVIIQYWF